MLEHYNSLLKTIRGLDPSAHIGGGAVRDTLLERPIKDIDLFLDNSVSDNAAKLLRSEFGFVKVGEWKNYEMFSDPAVTRRQTHYYNYKTDEWMPREVVDGPQLLTPKAR